MCDSDYEIIPHGLQGLSNRDILALILLVCMCICNAVQQMQQRQHTFAWLPIQMDTQLCVRPKLGRPRTASHSLIDSNQEVAMFCRIYRRTSTSAS